MARLPHLLARCAVAASFCALVAGCEKSSATAPSAPVAAASEASAVVPIRHGVIRGRVLFAGPRPVMGAIDVSGFPACGNHAPPIEQYAIVNPNGTLKNVLVYVQGAGRVSGAGLPPVVLDQAGCQYVPHVVALRVGQKLSIRSSDDTLHNVHGQPSENPAFNFAEIAAGASRDLAFNEPEIFRIKCDVHPWMNACVGVFENGCFALTGDDGSFEIRDVPAGDYTLIAWHEHYDTLQKHVSVRDGEPVAADFTYGPAAN